MDFFGVPRGSIRSQALNKLAALSLSKEEARHEPVVKANGVANGYANGSMNGSAKTGLSGDILKLANAVAREDISDVAISHKELEIIFALTSAAPKVQTEQQATDLVAVLSPYFLESPSQKFKSHASMQLGPSPWDYLTNALTESFLVLCNKFDSIVPKVEALFGKFIARFGVGEEMKMTCYFSLLGFLKSLVKMPSPLDKSLTSSIVSLFTAEFLDSVEGVTLRALEEEHELTYLLAYKATGDEFNSLLFAKLVQQFFNRVLLTLITRDFLETVPNIDGLGLIDYLLLVNSTDFDDEPDVASKLDKLKTVLSRNVTLIKELCNRASSQIDELDNGSTYINLSSAERVDLAMRTKSLALQVLAAGLIVDVVPNEYLIENIKSVLSHPTEALDNNLVPVVISIGSLLTYKGQKGISGDLIHTFPLLVSKITPDATTEFVKKISKCLALGLKPLNEDSIITTIYSLVNLLVSDNFAAPVTALRELRLRTATNTFGSRMRPSRSNTVHSRVPDPADNERSEHAHVFQNAITSAIEIAKVYDDDAITVLTVTILSQKFLRVSRELDFYLLDGLSDIAPALSEKEFLTLLKLFDSGMNQDNSDTVFVEAIVGARLKIAKALEGKFGHPLYYVYLQELLNSVVALGDVQNTDHRSQGEISEIAIQISRYIPPIAQMLPKKDKLTLLDDSTVILFQNFWFNIVVHGYNETSELTKRFLSDLQVIALNSPPLASDSARSRAETSFELSTVLRRGSSNHNVKDQKHIISGVSNTNMLELKALSYQKLMFLSATSLLENLRVNVGDCSTILHYFGDPSVEKASLEKFIGSIAISVVQKYAKLTASGRNAYFTSDMVADQLTKILILCVDRNYNLQDAAFQSASVFLGKLPSSLCNRGSLYTLLDLLTAMYDSLLDSERKKYHPKRDLYLKHTKAKITVSDSRKWKEHTLKKLQDKAREWCLMALYKSNQDLKTLLMGYISDLGLFGELSDIELGISFAVDMAGAVLPGDTQAVTPKVSNNTRINTIATFLSEYSWRARNMNSAADLDPYTQDPNENPLASAIRAHKRALGYESEWAQEAGVTPQDSRNDLSYILFSEIVVGWHKSLKKHEGLFSTKYDLTDEGFLKMTYSPSDKVNVDYHAGVAAKNLETDEKVIQFLTSHFQGTLYQSEHMLQIFTDAALESLQHLKTASLHPFARLVRFQLIKFALNVLDAHIKTGSHLSVKLVESILDGILSWFIQARPYPFGDNELKIRADMNLLIEVFDHLRLLMLPARKNGHFEEKRELALAFLFDEINKMMIWLSPLEPREFKGETFKADTEMLEFAYNLNPALAFSLARRTTGLEKSITALVTKDPTRSLSHPEAVKYLVNDARLSKYLILAKPVSPTESINLFRPPYIKDPYAIQYNMRALEAQDINLTFFYVPQIVQCLTNDSLGYVARFIVEAGKVSQKFSHQLIWNLLANTENPDLRAEKMIDMIKTSYDRDAMEYYEKEFGFFDEVTSISGKLQPYLKKTKAEKKVKIDEEMAKIVVLDDVYLPSNPDGVVVDINRVSGKPLQSHAKTPFLATFKIRKQEEVSGELVTVDKWQSAIFKVGDDCRQDVLALQLISIFKSVWENAGLDLYCYPYRVTATAPGCGVIDVLPNSISRDLLGREAVNDLYTYFKAKFPDGELEFEDAVQNFVKSLAAYSIISYLLQFKDRHNGNIMYDDKGHILHIDFGFCFDIVPGGVKFEACPFKLTKEMVRVMGGSNDTESFKMFEELFIKGFLAIRPYHELIIGNVQSMLDSGLPCFKGEKTIKNLRNRFFLGKDDKECIKALKGLIRQSYESMFSLGYDKFQKMTNGIPY